MHWKESLPQILRCLKILQDSHQKSSTTFITHIIQHGIIIWVTFIVKHNHLCTQMTIKTISAKKIAIIIRTKRLLLLLLLSLLLLLLLLSKMWKCREHRSFSNLVDSENGCGTSDLTSQLKRENNIGKRRRGWENGKKKKKGVFNWRVAYYSTRVASSRVGTLSMMEAGTAMLTVGIFFLILFFLSFFLLWESSFSPFLVLSSGSTSASLVCFLFFFAIPRTGLASDGVRDLLERFSELLFACIHFLNIYSKW